MGRQQQLYSRHASNEMYIAHLSLLLLPDASAVIVAAGHE